MKKTFFEGLFTIVLAIMVGAAYGIGLVVGDRLIERLGLDD